MTTNLKSVQTSAVMTTVFTRSNATPVANEAMFRAAGQRLRYPRHQESRGSNVCPDPSTLLPPPPPPSALAYPMPLADCVAMEHLEMEGRKGEDISYEQARGGSRLTTRKRQAFEADNELNHVQLHNKKNVGRRPSHSTSNMRNCDEEANQISDPVIASDPQQRSQAHEHYLFNVEDKARRAAQKIFDAFNAASSKMASKFRTLQKLRDVLRQDQVKAGHAGARASALERKAEERHIAHRQARFEADVVIASRDDFFVAQAEIFSVRGTEQWEWEWEAHKKAEQAGKDEKTAREKAEKAWQVAEEEDAMVETAKRMLKKAEKAYGDARRMEEPRAKRARC